MQVLPYLIFMSNFLIYNVNSDCKIDDFIINIGKKVNSISGLLDGVVNFVFRYLTSDTSKMDAYVTANNYVEIGKLIGTYIKMFFNSEVASYNMDFASVIKK